MLNLAGNPLPQEMFNSIVLVLSHLDNLQKLKMTLESPEQVDFILMNLCELEELNGVGVNEGSIRTEAISCSPTKLSPRTA